MLISKSKLAEELGWTRPRLDRRLKSDPHFPIRTRGMQGGGWWFDLADVLAYLDDEPAPEAGDQGSPRDGDKPACVSGEGVDPPPKASRRHAKARTADHRGEASARQRRDMANALLSESRVRKEQAELVEISEVRSALTTVLQVFHSGLDKLPELLMSQAELPPDALLFLQRRIAAIRANLDRNTAPLLADRSST